MKEKNMKNFCEDCLYWWPYPFISFIGICGNFKCPYYYLVRLSKNQPCEFFEYKDLNKKEIEGIEFYWCDTCKDFFFKGFLFLHNKHKIFTGVALPDVEFNVENTSAAD